MITWLEQAHFDCSLPPAPALPRTYADVTLEAVKREDVRSTVSDYLERFTDAGVRGIAPVLLGTAGEFKTVAAAVLAREIWQRFQVRVHWAACGSALTLLELERYQPATAKRIRLWCNVPVLVMDDFAVARPETWGSDMVRAVSSARHDLGLPTIWTGNLALPRGREYERISELYGPLFARRLEERGRGFTVLL